MPPEFGLAEGHLTAEEVNRLLEFVAHCSPIVVGGQSINIWAALYKGRDAELDDMAPLTSKDIDFYQNKRAAQELAANLENGALFLPKADDFTPNAAVVTGKLGDRSVTIDFMASVKGVKSAAILSRSITIADVDNPAISITLMHPLDCIRSRLSNINELKRTSKHSVAQAAASVKILECYIETELDEDTSASRRRAGRALQELEYIIKNHHIGRVSHDEYESEIGLEKTLIRYQNDARFDERWLVHTYGKILTRIQRRMAVLKLRRGSSA